MNIKSGIILAISFCISIINGQGYDETCSKARLGEFFLSTASKEKSVFMNYDVKFYDLYLDISPENNIINGKNRILGIITGESSITSIKLDLSHPLVVDSVTSANGGLTFDHANNILTVYTSDTLRPGDLLDLTVYYQGTPASPSNGWGNFNFDIHNGHSMIWTLSEPFGSPRWWPCKDTPLDKADSMHIDIRLPLSGGDTLMAVSNGLLVNTEFSDGYVTYSWETKYPMATYLAAISVYPYVHWREWFQFDSGDSMPLDYYVFEDMESQARTSYAITSDMMVVFNDLFGDYPFKKEKYGHYMFLFGGGMEHQTLTGLGTTNESTIAHELAHQWYGDLVTCEDFGHIWLNEGFARYSQALWEEFQYGISARNQYMKYIEYYGPGTVFVPDNSSNFRIFDFGLTYNKAGWIVHMLRYVLGDSIFFEVIREFTHDPQFKFRTMNTEQLRDYCESKSGLDLDTFFEQWIYGEFYPEYSYNWAYVGDTLKYRVDQVSAIFDMPLDLGIVTARDTLIHRMHISEKSNIGKIPLESNTSVINVILDPGNWVLNTSKRDNSLEISNHIPAGFTLGYPYPNPFNPEMKLSFRTTDRSPAGVSIFDVSGNEIFSKILETKLGNNMFTWDGRSEDGISLATGVYMIQISIDGRSQVRKVIFLK